LLYFLYFVVDLIKYLFPPMYLTHLYYHDDVSYFYVWGDSFVIGDMVKP
jgi:hypothetical protein